MWEMLGWAAWAISAAIFIGLGWDFVRVNASYSEDVLLSSREGVDELFGSASQAPGE
jgi:hypothetical protein